MMEQLDAKAQPSTDSGSIGNVSGGCLLMANGDEWIIQCGKVQTELRQSISASELASQVSQAISAATPKIATRCVIAMDSVDCFFVRASVDENVDVKDRMAVSFELERHFPLDAEAMTSDYVACAGGRQYCALAAQTDRFREMVTAVEKQGIEIVAIVPRSFLTARGVLSEQGEKSTFECWLFDRDRCETLQVDPQGVWQWKQFSGPEGLRFDQSVAQGTPSLKHSDDDPPIVVVGADQEQLARDGLSVNASTRWSEQPSRELIANGASLVLSGKWGSWLNLRQGQLAPADPLQAVSGPLRWLAMAAGLCFVTLAAASWYRGERIAEESARIKTQQTDAYREAFPGSRPPVLLMRSIRRQHSRTLGSRGGGSNEIELPTPATVVIAQLYRGLTQARKEQGARFRLVDINIIDGDCQVTVRVKDTEDLGEIAKALESIGFEVAPPAADRIDPSKDEPLPTYQSTISAIWKNADRQMDSSPVTRIGQ